MPTTTTPGTGPTPHRHIYILGLKPDLPSPDFVTPYGTWSQIKSRIDADIARAGRNGFTITLQVILPGSDEGAEAGLETFEKQLSEMREGIDGLMFGSGIRTAGDVVPFERALGVAMKVLGPKVVERGLGSGSWEESKGFRLMLNDGPDRHCWALERGFGVVMGVE